jgi:spore maturation protein CgeB
MNWKEFAKKLSILRSINAKLKCYKLKRNQANLARDYDAKASNRGVDYSEDQAINEFKNRHISRCPGHSPAALGALRVFWVGTNQSQDESGFLQALHRIAKVTVFHNIEGEYGIWSGNEATSLAEIRQANDQELMKQIEEARSKDGVDVLLGQMWAGRISKEVLVQVQELGIPVINIAMDDRLPVHWSWRNGVRMGSIGLKTGVDIVLTTSSETCLWYAVEGCPAIYWPLASDPSIFAPDEEVVRNIDVLFIGNRYGIRGKIVDHLERHGILVSCYGAGWPNGYANAEKCAALSKRARIILGIGTVGHCHDVYTLKLRDFDALMTGALYVTHRNPDLGQLFMEGQEFECYDTMGEAVSKIRYYLAHAEARERIGLAGQQKSISRDTWDNRLATTFRQLGLLQF